MPRFPMHDGISGHRYSKIDHDSDQFATFRRTLPDTIYAEKKFQNRIDTLVLVV